MRHHPLRQPQDATKASASPQPTRTTRPSAHPVLQRQALLGNQSTNQWLDEQPQEAEAMQPSLTSSPSPFRGLSQELGAARPQLPIQAKLMVGAVNDKYEQEADRVAKEVVQRINSPVPQPTGESPTVQRKSEEEDEIQMKPMVQSVGAEGGAVSAAFETQLNRARGSGQSLMPELQAQMGQAMGADFSGVRVHTDGQADQLNQMVEARAFAMGQDLFFKRGEYQPGNRGGQELIAHELTHVIQQKNHAESYGFRKAVQRVGGRKEGTFIGNQAGIHLHINIGTPHLQIGTERYDIKGRDLGGTYSLMRCADALEALTAIDRQNVPGGNTCREWLENQLNGHVIRPPHATNRDNYPGSVTGSEWGKGLIISYPARPFVMRSPL